ncbi:hypothetical protein SBOR_9703 [Sclerotinia borealis F-4128]|uniref:Uncharacterized protein n=1 Tax=Sclerotinia borealis (strain F-4128) TaxID=1432307 RepID=W9C4T8_SCLBF|nr:hypothetical protein SBOR_9703 [Sclerotinia borealis F-4128]
MPPLRHSISQLFAPHPAFALRNPPSQSQAQSLYTAPSSSTNNNNDEMVSSLQPKRPTTSILRFIYPVPLPLPLPSTTSAPTAPCNSLPSASPSFSTLSHSLSHSHPTSIPTSIPPRSQIEAFPPPRTGTPYRASPTPSLSPSLSLSYTLDPSKRHPVFFTNKLRKAPTGVDAHEYSNEVWRAGSPVARGYVYESGGVEEREMKL